MSPRKSATSAHNASRNGGDINYGSLLYHKGLKRKEELSKAMTDKRKEMMDK